MRTSRCRRPHVQTPSPPEPGERPHFCFLFWTQLWENTRNHVTPPLSGAHGFQGGFPLGRQSQCPLELLASGVPILWSGRTFRKRWSPGEGERFCPWDRAGHSEVHCSSQQCLTRWDFCCTLENISDLSRGFGHIHLQDHLGAVSLCLPGSELGREVKE